jgi:membrane-associated phospholipid phosphatase
MRQPQRATEPAAKQTDRKKDEDSPDLDAGFDREPQAERRWWWLALLGVNGVVMAGAAFVAHAHTVASWELNIFHFINGWADTLRPFFLVATIAPESLWIAVVAVLATFVLRLYRVAWQLAAATVTGYIATYILKEGIERPRPVDLIDGAHVRVHETGMGFPSGHTMIITVVVLTLWPYLPRGWRWLIALLIVLMGVSRIYLGVHAPLDVVGGFAVGALIVGGMRVLPTVIRRFFRFD